MIEPRQSPRRRQLKTGIIAFQNRHATLPCSVRDVSVSGARLGVDQPHVPDTFVLLIELDGIEADCEVIWRRKGLIGVAFVGQVRHVPPRRAQVVIPTQPQAAPSLRRRPA